MMKFVLFCVAALVLAGCGVQSSAAPLADESSQQASSESSSSSGSDKASQTTKASAHGDKAKGGTSTADSAASKDDATTEATEQEGGSAAADGGTSGGQGQQAREDVRRDLTSKAVQAELANCGLAVKDITYMQRDWERMVGSIGRDDHEEYVRALATTLDSLRKKGGGCQADSGLQRFLADVKQIDKASEARAGKDDLYGQAAAAGNEWLGDLDITQDELAAG